MTREDLRPRAETTLRDLCALLYPATVGHDVVVYAAGDGPWSARWRWAARYGSRVVARRALRDLWPDAAQRAEGIARVRALDPESADALAAVDVEGV